MLGRQDLPHLHGHCHKDKADEVDSIPMLEGHNS
jgi:hypothetical protein